jgi:hypothetical protein
MMRTVGAGIFLALAALMPAQQAAAQDPVAGAIVGGALGAMIGGAVGRGAGGAIAGAAIGATTGAVIAAEAQRRNGGYYWWHGGCYYRYPNGAWVQIQPGIVRTDPASRGVTRTALAVDRHRGGDHRLRRFLDAGAEEAEHAARGVGLQAVEA